MSLIGDVGSVKRSDRYTHVLVDEAELDYPALISGERVSSTRYACELVRTGH